jgi:hypothetical protein
MQNLMLDLETLTVETFAPDDAMQSFTAYGAEFSAPASELAVCDTGCC